MGHAGADANNGEGLNAKSTTNGQLIAVENPLRNTKSRCKGWDENGSQAKGWIWRLSRLTEVVSYERLYGQRMRDGRTRKCK